MFHHYHSVRQTRFNQGKLPKGVFAILIPEKLPDQEYLAHAVKLIKFQRNKYSTLICPHFLICCKLNNDQNMIYFQENVFS